MNFFLNFLALVSIGFGFILNFFLVRIFGLGTQLDIFYSSLNLLTFINYGVQIVYEGYAPYYASIKGSSSTEADRLYSCLLNRILIVSTIVISGIWLLAPMIVSWCFNGNAAANDFFKIISIIIMLQNIDLLNRSLINLNFKFKIIYFCDIIFYFGIICFVFLFSRSFGVLSLAYAYIISYIVILIFEFIYIHVVLKTRYFFALRNENSREIIRGSFLLKLGSFLYGSKDIIINKMLLGMGPGVVSMYSTASKYASAISSVTNAPTINVFANKVMYTVSENNVQGILGDIKTVIKKLTIIFWPCVAVTYLILPKFLGLLMKISYSQSIEIRNIFIILSLFMYVIVYDAPFSRTITAFKRFDLSFLTSLGFIVVFVLMLAIFPRNVFSIAFAQIIAQIINACMYVFFVLRLIRKRKMSVTGLHNNREDIR